MSSNAAEGLRDLSRSRVAAARSRHDGSFSGIIV